MADTPTDCGVEYHRDVDKQTKIATTEVDYIGYVGAFLTAHSTTWDRRQCPVQ